MNLKKIQKLKNLRNYSFFLTLLCVIMSLFEQELGSKLILLSMCAAPLSAALFFWFKLNKEINK
jgi:hypothetical protein